MSASFRRNCSCALAAITLLAACGRSPLLPTHGQVGGEKAGESGATPTRHPWPLFGRDAQGTRRSPVDASGSTGKLKWRFKANNEIHGSPLIGADGTIYVLSGQASYPREDPIIYAISPPTTGNTGVLKWRFVLPQASGFDDPAANIALGEDGTVYVAADQLYAVSPPSTGTEGVLKWSYRVPRTKIESHELPLGAPTIGTDGTIYVAGAQLYALTPASKGSPGLKWSFDDVSGTNTPPAIAADGTVYLYSDQMVGISPPTVGTKGSLKWSLPAHFYGWSSAVADDGTIYGTESGHDTVVAVSLPSTGGEGKVAWTYPTGCGPGYVDSSLAIGADGTLYVGCTDGDLLAIARPEAGNIGELRWRWLHHGGHGYLSSPAVAADGTVFFGANDRRIYAVRPPETGTIATEKWAFETQGPVYSSPAIGPDGTVYAGSVDHYLYAIE